MPRRSDMELAFRSAIVHERSGRRVVKTADFVQELLKVNWNLSMGNDSNLLIVFYVQIMPDYFVMQLHRF